MKRRIYILFLFVCCLVGVLWDVVLIRKNRNLRIIKNTGDMLDFKFIKEFETGDGQPILTVFRNRLDGNLEAGYGHVLSPALWSVGDKIDKATADDWFLDDIAKAVGVYGSSLAWDRFSKNQRRAIISHAYNTGSKSATIIRLANAEKWAELAEWWRKHYITAKGVELAGLVRRRNYEADLLLL